MVSKVHPKINSFQTVTTLHVQLKLIFLFYYVTDRCFCIKINMHTNLREKKPANGMEVAGMPAVNRRAVVSYSFVRLS